MKRRDFMKTLAVAPVGMVGAEERGGPSFGGTVSWGGAFTRSLFFHACDDSDCLVQLARIIWKLDQYMEGRKVITTIHKDGLDVRFV